MVKGDDIKVSTFEWSKIPNALDHTPWHKNKGIKRLNFMILVIYMGQFLNGYDGTILGGLQALPYWHEDLGYPNSSRIGLLNAMAYIAGFCSGPFVSYFMDKVGRKWCLRYYVITMMIGTVLGCIAGTVQGNGGFGLFCASKFIIGSGISSGLMTMQVMVQEIPHPRYRTLCATLFDTNWTLGHVLGAWLNFGTSYIDSSWSWRIPYLVQILPALFILIAIQFIPDTPRWLMGKGREQEALDFLVQYHGNGDPNDELVKFEFLEIKETIAAEKEASKVSWKVILMDKANRHRLFLVGWITFTAIMSGGSIIDFYYTTILTQAGVTGASRQTAIGAGLSIYQWLWELLGVYVMGFVGRRPMLIGTWPVLIFLNMMLVICSAVYVKHDDIAAGYASIVFVWLFSGFIGLTNPIMYSYCAEVLTFTLRARGMGLWNTVNQGFGVYNAYVNSVALNAIGYYYYIVFMGLNVIQVIVMYLTFVETKGLTLEEIAILFEGKDAAVAKVDAEYGLEHQAATYDGDSDKKDMADVDVKEV